MNNLLNTQSIFQIVVIIALLTFAVLFLLWRGISPRLRHGLVIMAFATTLPLTIWLICFDQVSDLNRFADNSRVRMLVWIDRIIQIDAIVDASTPASNKRCRLLVSDLTGQTSVVTNGNLQNIGRLVYIQGFKGSYFINEEMIVFIDQNSRSEPIMKEFH